MSEDESTDAEEKIEQFKSILIPAWQERNRWSENGRIPDEENDPNWIVGEVIKIAELKGDVKTEDGKCDKMW